MALQLTTSDLEGEGDVIALQYAPSPSGQGTLTIYQDRWSKWFILGLD